MIISIKNINRPSIIADTKLDWEFYVFARALVLQRFRDALPELKAMFSMPNGVGKELRTTFKSPVDVLWRLEELDAAKGKVFQPLPYAGKEVGEKKLLCAS